MTSDACCHFLGQATSNLLKPPIPKRLNRRFGLELGNVFHGVSFYALSEADAAAALEVLPSVLRPHFRACWMEVSGDIPPHVHNVFRSSINIYVESRGATTSFWKPRGESVKTWRLSDQSDSHQLDPADLEWLASFSAQNGEMWLLDVTRPHSVAMQEEGLRRAYALESNLSFDEVLALWQVTDNRRSRSRSHVIQWCLAGLAALAFLVWAQRWSDRVIKDRFPSKT